MSASRRRPDHTDLAAAVTEAHILVTTGAGGVGKTTTAAALGVAAARAGRRTLVLTIDPAKRLAQAMGVDQLDDTPVRVPLDGIEGTLEGDVEATAGGAPGELHAMMLDVATTFDRLIDRHAASPANARAIKANRIYRTLASTLSGTQEYMAMERLHELHDAGGWDLLIVDTPPTRSALDFLDAPKRMTTFLDGRLLRLLMKPSVAAGRGAGRVVGFGATAFIRVAGRVTGMDLLEDLAAFFRAFDGMYDGFKQRAQEVLALLQQPSSRFVVVTSPEPPPLREARYFLERLEQEGLHAAGLVVNRVRPEVPRDPSDAAIARAVAAQPGDVDGRAVAGALTLLGEVRSLAAQQRRDVAAARYGLRLDTVVHVPLLDDDVHDLSSLAEIATTLTTGSSR